MNNDELQKAIDDITKEAPAASTEATPVDAEALANEMVATTGGAREGVTLNPTGAAPVAPAPTVPEVPAMPPVEPVAVAPAVPAVEEPVVGGAGLAQVDVSTDLAAVEREAMKELYPLISKVDLTPEDKFEVCMTVAEDDRAALSGALEAAKQISDDTAKAEALLRIISFNK